MHKQIFLIMLIASLFFVLPLFTTNAIEGNLVSVGLNQWVHVSIEGVPVESFGWQVYFGKEVQLSFYAYNDSSVMYHAFVIVANRSYFDPLEKFKVYWDGTLYESSIVFTVSSDLGRVAMVVQAFAGETPIYGRPKMTQRFSLITMEGKIWDVLVNNEHVASFEWSYVTLTSNQTGSNQTLPQLTVYKNDGSIYDTRVATTALVPITEFQDKVGIMVEAFSTSYIKWLLYSGYPINVRLSSGFGASLVLPYFSVTPYTGTVQPNELVTIAFKLPEGAKNYTANWNTTYLKTYLTVQSEIFNPNTKEYTVTLSFHDNAEGNRFTLEVQADKYGAIYRSSTSITVVAPIWKTLILPIGSVAFIGFLFFLIIWRGREARRVPPDDTVAIEG